MRAAAVGEVLLLVERQEREAAVLAERAGLEQQEQPTQAAVAVEVVFLQAAQAAPVS
jgi:hypothetical protein